MNVFEASIAELQRAMQEGATTARALVEQSLARIAAYDDAGPGLNAITRLAPDALREADERDEERARSGPRGPLHGIPFVVKDNMNVAGLPTTAGSKALATLVPDQDAFGVRRLREAGAIVLAKTNLHELAAGIETVSSAGGRTRNPYDPERNPGGSSGGTAAAVAASFAAFGTGSDTCGSIRIPAAQNGLVGLRTTQGLTSRSGVVPLSLTQDVVGPLARTVADLAVALDAMVGADADDAGTAVAKGRATRFAEAATQTSLAGRRIGVLMPLFGGEPADEAVTSVCHEALGRLGTEGATIVPVDVPELLPLLDVEFLVLMADLPGDLAAFFSRHPSAPVATLDELLETGLVHPEVAPVLQAAVAQPIRESDAYRGALANRERIRASLEGAIEAHSLDALAYPPILRVAGPLGEPQTGSNAHAAANSGLPAISVPAGHDASGHPVGLEFLGRAFSDETLVSVAAAVERVLDARRPPGATPTLDA